jgi:hypothetical protein
MNDVLNASFFVMAPFTTATLNVTVTYVTVEANGKEIVT